MGYFVAKTEKIIFVKKNQSQFTTEMAHDTLQIKMHVDFWWDQLRRISNRAVETLKSATSQLEFN